MNFAKVDAFIFKWRIHDILCVWKRHPIPFVFGSLLLFFMGVKYTLRVIPASAPPFDIGFIATKWLHSIHRHEVAGSVIASLDMRRMERWELARLFDVLNMLQVVRLLGTRGHYTSIDLAVGVGAGMLFDSLGEKYVESRKKYQLTGS